MATLVLRLTKGSPLTNLEVDNNFSGINTELGVVGSNVGLITNLTTFNKGNLVVALNEVLTRSTSNVTITGGNITGVQNVSVSGNVFANYFKGNGSLLTGITVDSTRIVSGTTNFSITGVNGNVELVLSGTRVLTANIAGSKANVNLSGNLYADGLRTAAVQDSSGRTLRILDESNVVVWGG